MTFEERMAELGVDLSDLPDYAENERFSLLGIIFRLIDIIDRMETRIVNLTVERDWLKECARYDECPTCVNHDKHNPLLCEIDDDWMQDKDGRCKNYVYSGVPEDWRVDDA